MSKSLGNLMICAAIKLWRTDAKFTGWPFGPPDRGLRYGTAWRLYHWGLRLTA